MLFRSFAFLVTNSSPSLSVVIEQGVHSVNAVRNVAQNTFFRPFFLQNFVEVIASVSVYGFELPPDASVVVVVVVSFRERAAEENRERTHEHTQRIRRQLEQFKSPPPAKKSMSHCFSGTRTHG